MLFICDYRHPLNKRCLCLRSKVSADSELLRFFREESIEGRTPYLGRVARGGLLQREGWKCSRWEIWDKTSNFSDASYHICFRRGFILRWGVELTLNAEPYVWSTLRQEVLACILEKSCQKLQSLEFCKFLYSETLVSLTVRKKYDSERFLAKRCRRNTWATNCWCIRMSVSRWKQTRQTLNMTLNKWTRIFFVIFKFCSYVWFSHIKAQTVMILHKGVHLDTKNLLNIIWPHVCWKKPIKSKKWPRSKT